MVHGLNMKTTNPRLDEAFHSILDCFTGTDGGARFMHLQCFIEEFDRRAANGDKAAAQITEVVYQFDRLIQIANSK